MNIGILGPKGRLGSCLVARGHTALDFNVIQDTRIDDGQLNNFDVIINCAAKTKVDACQHGQVPNEYYKEAIKVNTRALEYIRSNFGGRLIHLSTDYVFKCNKGPYSESDKRDPVNDYGYTKYGGELILETHPLKLETVVVRTTGLFGSQTDFSYFVFDTLRKGQVVVASHELFGNQTYVPHLAQALEYVAGMSLKEHFSYLHVASSDVMSRYDFAIMVANVFGLPTDNVFPRKNKDIENWVAPRPTKGGMKVKLAQKLGVPIYSTLEGLKEYRKCFQS